ncbi:hypothetical protein F1880_003644 [Penicillium rolfsii]|nr:hypothetical protein F1880_003644 [Penicillium rolfsii]
MGRAMTERNEAEIQEIYGIPDVLSVLNQLDQLDALDYAVNFAPLRSRLVPLLIPLAVSRRNPSLSAKIRRT